MVNLFILGDRGLWSELHSVNSSAYSCMFCTTAAEANVPSEELY